MTLDERQRFERAYEQLNQVPRTETIKEVREREDSWDITTEQSSGFVLDKKHGVRPETGAEVTLYLHQGSMIHGVDLDGEPVFYMTAEEREKEHQKMVERRQNDLQRQFDRDRDELDEKYDKLPLVFQRRFDKFRRTNPDWRWEHEAYEMSSCVDAVNIAEALKTPEAVEEFAEMDSDGQREAVPNLAYDVHSGNSFGFAVRLAHHYLTDPKLVVLEHGALTPLTGCKEYGCPHPVPDDLLEGIE